MLLIFNFIVLMVLAKIGKSNGFATAIDYKMHSDALDPEICDKQLSSLGDPTKKLFAESNSNVPSNVYLRGQRKFLGNFEKCLSISDHVAGTRLTGKYCRVDASLPSPFPVAGLSNETLMQYERYAERRKSFKMYVEYGCETNIVNPPANSVAVRIDICIPAACITERAIDWAFNKTINFDGSFVPGVRFVENFCRLPGDKPFATAEMVAIMIFLTIVIANILSTAFDIYLKITINKCEPHPTYESFSIYSNTRRLVNYRPSADSVDCADGIRTLSLFSIVMFHKTLALNDHYYKFNDFDYFNSSGIVAVDTFFVLGGLFLVYTTTNRFTCETFLKNLHMFYLKRILRLWPLMAACVLITSSFIAHITDGPNWGRLAKIANGCRLNWWPTLLFVRNQVQFCSSNTTTCLGHFWYIAVDMQLYVLSPLILMWLFGSRRRAWLALALAGSMSVVICAAFSFSSNLTYYAFHPDPQTSWSEKVLYRKEYNSKYYKNPLTRAAPFVVGIIAGYVLHCHRTSNLRIRKSFLYTFWILSLLTIASIAYGVKAFQVNVLSQTQHNLMNSFSRAVWGLAVAWIIVACHKGYGGPVNWFLSLRMWKLLSRLSYAMYLVHIPIIDIYKYRENYEPVEAHMNVFLMPLAELALSFVVAFVLTVVIDMPVQNLQRIYLHDKMYGAKPTNAANDIKETAVSNENTIV